MFGGLFHRPRELVKGFVRPKLESCNAARPANTPNASSASITGRVIDLDVSSIGDDLDPMEAFFRMGR
jgi:hypothetical protein